MKIDLDNQFSTETRRLFNSYPKSRHTPVSTLARSPVWHLDAVQGRRNPSHWFSPRPMTRQPVHHFDRQLDDHKAAMALTHSIGPSRTDEIVANFEKLPLRITDPIYPLKSRTVAMRQGTIDRVDSDRSYLPSQNNALRIVSPLK